LLYLQGLGAFDVWEELRLRVDLLLALILRIYLMDHRQLLRLEGLGPSFHVDCVYAPGEPI